MEDYQVQILTALFAFLAGWGLSLLNDRRHKLQNTKDAYNSLMFELKEIDDFLIKRQQKKMVTFDGERIKTEGYTLGTSRFDSLIFSGMFRQLDFDVQDQTVKVYGLIKIVNKSSNRLIEIITDRDSASMDFVHNTTKYGDRVEKQVEEIKNKIPPLIDLIEKRKPSNLL